MKELGVFCGTFNPIHWGHLLMAERARDQFGLTKVLLVVSPNPPHRTSDLLDAEDRYQLVEAAASENDSFEASRMELDRKGTSYTVDTLLQIQEENGKDVRINFIVGEDNLTMLTQWHKAEVLLSICRLLVAPRATIHDDLVWTPPDVSTLPPETVTGVIDFPHVPVSASDIRERLRTGKSILYLVPTPVHHLIMERKYYMTGDPSRR